MGCKRAQDLRKLVRAELAGSTSPRRERRKPDLRHQGLLIAPPDCSQEVTERHSRVKDRTLPNQPWIHSDT